MKGFCKDKSKFICIKMLILKIEDYMLRLSFPFESFKTSNGPIGSHLCNILVSSVVRILFYRSYDRFNKMFVQ